MVQSADKLLRLKELKVSLRRMELREKDKPRKRIKREANKYCRMGLEKDLKFKELYVTLQHLVHTLVMGVL